MEIARDQAALAWQSPKTSSREMDPHLAEEFAGIVYTWIVGAKGAEMQNLYYRGILEQINQRLACQEEARFANLPAVVGSLVNLLQDMTDQKTRLEARIANLESKGTP